jgi:hypothetical protein
MIESLRIDEDVLAGPLAVAIRRERQVLPFSFFLFVRTSTFLARLFAMTFRDS